MSPCLFLSLWACVWVSPRRVQGVLLQLYEILPNDHRCFIPSLPALPCCSLLQSHRSFLGSNPRATEQPPLLWWSPATPTFLASLPLTPIPAFPASFAGFSCPFSLSQALPSLSNLCFCQDSHACRARQVWLRWVLSGQHDFLEKFRIWTPRLLFQPPSRITSSMAETGKLRSEFPKLPAGVAPEVIPIDHQMHLRTLGFRTAWASVCRSGFQQARRSSAASSCWGPLLAPTTGGVDLQPATASCSCSFLTVVEAAIPFPWWTSAVHSGESLLTLEINYSFLRSDGSVSTRSLALNSLLLQLAIMLTVIYNWTLTNRTLEKLGFDPWLILYFPWEHILTSVSFIYLLNHPKRCVKHLLGTSHRAEHGRHKTGIVQDRPAPVPVFGNPIPLSFQLETMHIAVTPLFTPLICL